MKASATSISLCILSILSGGSLQAQTYLHLRYGGGPKITITGASNSTPIQITTATPHGFSPGDIVWIWGVEGNWNADGTRIVKDVQDATHFTIRYMNGNDAVGNGSFSPASRIGAWVGSTVAYPLTSHPRLWLDGPNGSLTARMKDPDGSGGATAPRAQPGNPPWDAITSWLDGNINSNYQWDSSNFALFRNGSFAPILTMGLRWFSDNSQTKYRDGAIHWIFNAERIVETLACDESVVSCGNPTDMDYGAGYFVLPLAETYSLIRDQLSQELATRFLSIMLNDKTDGDSCTGMYLPGTGTVTAATSAGVMTGSGTNWLSTLSPGDTIFPAGKNPWVVVSVDSDTQIHYRTSNLAGANFSGVNLPYEIAHPWQPGNCGWSFWAKHQGYSILSPGGAYPPAGGSALNDLFGNQFLTKTAAFLAVGLATADDDPRGARMAEGAANWFQDVGFPLYQKYWTGPTQIDSQYGMDRFGLFIAEIVWGLYNSTGGAVNYLGGNWLKNRALFDLYEFLPTSGNGNTYGIGYGTANLALRSWAKMADGPLFSQILNGTDEGAYLNYYMRQTRGDFTASSIKAGACLVCPVAYTFSDPTYTSKDYTSILPTSHAFIHTDAESTSPTTNTSMIIDRTGWTSSNDTLLHIMAVDVERDTNHLSSSANGSYNPASYSIYKRHQLLGEDSGTGLQTTLGYSNWDSKSMYMEIGGIANLKDANGTTVIADVEVPRYGDGGNGPNKNKYMYALVDASGAYNSSANLLRMNRHFVDFKGGSQQFILVYDDVLTSSGKMKRTYLHYPNNGESGEGFTSYDQANNTITSFDSPGGTALLTKVLFPGNPGFTYVDNFNGLYPGGVGQTFRVSICAGMGVDASGCDTGNSQAEFLVVHMPAANQSATLPPIKLMTSLDPTFRGVEIGGSSPKVALFARNGGLNSGVAFFSTQLSGTIQFLVAGLAAGWYSVWKDGTLLTTSQVQNRDNSLYFESTGGTFSVVLQPPPPPLQITSTSMSTAYAGIPYTVHWSATGGMPPYSWSIVSGSLPPGVTLQSDGTLSGIAMMAGAWSFTVQVVDTQGSRASMSSMLTVVAPTNDITVKIMSISSSNAILRYGRDGLDANVSCTISVATDAAWRNLVLQFSDAGGVAWRETVVDASGRGTLSPGTTYFLLALCGAEYGSAVLTTAGAAEHRPSPIRIHMQGPPMAQSVWLEYGSTPLLGSAVTQPCASSCEAQINAGPNAPLFMRRTYYNGNGQPIAASSTQAILIP
jgi:hypothetical protein